ncbi:hypothetical protein [methanotrophic endosymbiont of Bathymodiolus puteoserpentis (Logatchev)]|uniref:hypothetical protein n=1 Tax=methanotrophic endosymbiont of Bathymodiolus puteoserpentis (Logatchev) TaxID=343235 RepID=UPI00157AB9E8|nr:hypothetical protein [methanotrophic endosymbiont of Bathymodiolus puteoserpentis (Logatchev)]
MSIYKNTSRKFSAIVIGLSLVLMIWGASVGGVFNSSNGFLSNILMQVNLRSSISEKIMIVEAEHSLLNKGDEVWLAVLQNILSYDVRQVVFTFVPEQASDEFYQLARDSKNLNSYNKCITSESNG